LLGKATSEDGEVHVLIAQQVSGIRELIAGVVRDAQFGPCVMLGVGGVLAEALADVAFRPVPLTRIDADELISDLQSQALLGPLRGEPAVDRERLIDALVGLAQAAVDDPTIQSIDVNPMIVCDGVPIAVDALVEVSVAASPATSQESGHSK
jgi:acetate---CoA ligase (ADP-forming) subunit beta